MTLTTDPPIRRSPAGAAGLAGQAVSAGWLAVRAVWSPRTWLATFHTLVGMPIGLLTAGTVATLMMATVGLLCTVVLTVFPLVTLLVCNRAFTAIQRSRFHALGVRIEPVPWPAGPTWYRRLAAELRSGDTWRQVFYHLFWASVPGTVGGLAVGCAWSTGLALAALPAYAWVLPDGGPLGLDLGNPLVIAALTAAGLAALLAAPWLARGFVWLDTVAATGLLGPSRSQQLAKRVDDLNRSRAGVIDAADAERQRIERDLHDGAQQRLVSLAMNLGRARARLTDAPEPARQAITEAHEEAKQALSELRNFVRGLHPAVLNDRGLDAALSGIVARSPLPVALRVQMPRRCSPTIEAIAYFVVAEALTNVAKHAEATRAEVVVEHVDTRLRVVVTDDGRGGAAPDAGTGLRGLAQRTAAVDGTLRIDSPPGGPTTIEVMLPCES